VVLPREEQGDTSKTDVFACWR